MKIYFSGSIRGGRKYVQIYRLIIRHLMTYGDVLTAFIGDPSLDPLRGEGKSDSFIWERDVRWVGESEVVVAEVTQPSLGVGYEIAVAHQNHVPVLAFYQNDNSSRLSAMIGGDSNVKACPYKLTEEIFSEIDDFFKQLKS